MAKILSLFDGMACGFIAMQNAGVEIDSYEAFEIDPYAIKTATHNLPIIKEHGDVFAADFTQFEGVDWLIGGSPCFTAGHLVLTDNGYKDICEVSVGDLVLTHKGRYRPVVKTGSHTAQIFDVNIVGFPTFHTTQDHPFYTLCRHKSISTQYNATHSHRWFDRSPMWTPAHNLTRDHFCGQHIIDACGDNPYNVDKETMWILGRYVADGHVRKAKRASRKNSFQYQLILSIGEKKIDDFRQHVSLRHYSCYPHSQSVYRCVFSSMKLVNFVLEHNFGTTAHTKQIPEFVFALPYDLRLSFLEGYLSGDGSIDKTWGTETACTVSAKLAFGLQRLVIGLFHSNCGVSVYENNRLHYIDGREVRANYPCYRLTFKREMKKQSYAYVQDDIVWTGVKNVVCNGAYDTVYNIQVADDESYTVNNCIVHNCTNWSICQKKNRETTASGVGWELFQQYVRALREAKPRYFIYENNKSMSNAIRDSIRETFGFDEICINSALLSAQNRNRYYWVGRRSDDGTYSRVDIAQPVDRGILLRDVLEYGYTVRDKSYCITHTEGNVRDHFTHRHTEVKYEPVCVASRGRQIGGDHSWKQKFEARGDKTNALTTVHKDNMVAEPVCTTDGKARTIKAQYYKTAIANLVDSHHYPVSGAAEPVKSPIAEGPCRVGTYPNDAKNQAFDSQQYRVYSPDGKSVTLCGNGGGVGAKTGLYCFPTDGWYATACEWDENGKPTKAISCADGKAYKVYEVVNGLITVLDRQYPLAVADGYWIIRKLTVRECARLQTVPEWYEFPVSDSQAYKLLGNGWTCDVITHLIRGALAKEEK